MSERSIAIVDANNFYVSCERIFDPTLEGRPVVVLSNNDGCVVSRSAEAKALNIDMAVPWHTIAPLAQRYGIVAKSSNYELYGDMSARTAEILSRFTTAQEVYSIDESFIELHGNPREASAQGRAIRAEIRKLLGIPVSVGIAATKTLAKLANRGSKTRIDLGGVCNFSQYSPQRQAAILEAMPTSKIWGVGGRTARKLAGMGISNALALRESDPRRIRTRFGVVQERVVRELRGIDCLPLDDVEQPRDHIQHSRSFAIPIGTTAELEEVLSVYTQRAASRLRAQGSLARSMRCFAATSPFAAAAHTSHFVSLSFPEPTDDPLLMHRAAVAALAPQLEPDKKYVRVGVLLSEFVEKAEHAMLDVFDEETSATATTGIVDAIAARFGAEHIGLGLGGLRQRRAWTMKRDMVSPRATTHWDELAIVSAN